MIHAKAKGKFFVYCEPVSNISVNFIIHHNYKKENTL